ncbi:MAG: hypothetical protein J6P93_02300 [Alphaproteobacteria bacterium]|nr:hypothetical protein [Alphaproteobacteria bacterium]
MFENIEFIIPCGGKSLRNYPHAKGLGHKCLLPFGSVRIIDHILTQIIEAGGRKITIVCSSQDVIERFKEALTPTPELVTALRTKGHERIADALQETELPKDARIQYVIQNKPLGTSHVLGLAHRLSPDKHCIMIFPDDIYLPKNPQNNQIKKLLDMFIKNEKQMLATGIYQEDVSRYCIVNNGRLIEKSAVAYNHTAGFSPMAFPKEILDYMSSKIDDLENGTYQPSKVNGEWVFTEGVNSFLDEGGEEKGFSIKMLLKDDSDRYIDLGILPSYEHGMLLSLLTLSKYKDDHITFARAFLDTLSEKKD